MTTISPPAFARACVPLTETAAVEHDAVSLIELMIRAAEAAVTARSIGDAAHFERVRAAVAREVAKPCDGTRVMHDYLNVLADAVQAIMRARERYRPEDARLWCAIAGVILPDARADLAQALELRRRGQA